MFEPTDAELVTQILAGDQSMYRLVVERHQQAVYNTAYRLVGNPAEAADTAQEAFLRAYNALHTFRLDAPLKPWLCKIAANLALNLLKRRQPTVSLNDDLSGMVIDVPDLSTEPQANLLRVERQRQLHQAILTLPPEQRSIIELRHFQEQSYDEIAQALNLSLSNVKVRLFRARKNLGQILQKEM